MLAMVHRFFTKHLRLLSAVAIFALVLHVATDTDTWWHLSAGKWMVENGRLLVADPFSYTKFGETWVHVGYPFQILLYLVYRFLGFAGINLLAACTITLAYWLLWDAQKGQPILRAATIIVGAAIGASYGAARPHLTSLVFVALTLIVLEKAREGNLKLLRALPLISLFWANNHAGFWLGFVLIGVYGLEALIEIGRQENDRAYIRAWLNGLPGKLSLWGGLSVLTTLINPFGIRIYEAVFDTFVRKAEGKFISEWLSPDFHDPLLYPLLLGILGTLALFGLVRRPPRPAHLILALGMTTMTLTSTRHLAMFAIVMPVVWSHTLSESSVTLPEMMTDRFTPLYRQILAFASLLTLSGVVGISLYYALPDQINQETFAEIYPAQSTLDKLREMNLEGQLFSSYNWGGFLQWNLPEYPVYIDGRTDLFRDELFLKWIDVIFAEDDWQEELEARNGCAVLIENSRPIAKVLPLTGEWQEVARDSESVLFVRPCPAVSQQ